MLCQQHLLHSSIFQILSSQSILGCAIFRHFYQVIPPPNVLNRNKLKSFNRCPDCSGIVTKWLMFHWSRLIYFSDTREWGLSQSKANLHWQIQKIHKSCFSVIFSVIYSMVMDKAALFYLDCFIWTALLFLVSCLGAIAFQLLVSMFTWPQPPTPSKN